MRAIVPERPVNIQPAPPEVCQVDETHDPRFQWVQLGRQFSGLIMSSVIVPENPPSPSPRPRRHLQLIK
jgi:hypothetical protein